MKKRSFRYVGRHRKGTGPWEVLGVIGLVAVKALCVGLGSGLAREVFGQTIELREVIESIGSLLPIGGKGPQGGH